MNEKRVKSKCRLGETNEKTPERTTGYKEWIQIYKKIQKVEKINNQSNNREAKAYP